MKYALTVLATLAVLGLGALVFPYTGLMNVAATAGHSGIEQWYLSTMSRRSIQVRTVPTLPSRGKVRGVARGFTRT